MQKTTLAKYTWMMLIILIPSLSILPIMLNTIYFIMSDSYIYYDLSQSAIMLCVSTYLISIIGLFIYGYSLKNNKYLNSSFYSKVIGTVAYISIFMLCLLVCDLIAVAKFMGNRNGFDTIRILELVEKGMVYHVFDLTALFAMIGVMAGLKYWMKRQQFDVNRSRDETTGNFGTASWASEIDIKSYQAFNESNGILTGKDDKGRYIYLPLLNKLTISPQGGGKTTSSTIPVLLSYDGPILVFDVKGELWATTARYRSEVLKRHVVVIDPYQVTKGKDFIQGKSGDLLNEYKLNPFDWIPEDQRLRDRMINAFASSFVIDEGGGATHFDENAKILIRGFIDYMMQSLPKESRNLEMLYHLLSEQQEQAKYTFEQMSQLTGRAAAASNQIGRVGADERGSILSTSYRQIDWMSDSNIQNTLSESNFDLHDFLKGNMDIFIVLPEDQVKEHSRLVRMILALVMNAIVQANPSDLPNNKILFLLEELAQLGYCPGVEQAIEVLRSRGVVIWTVFQSLKQIEIFKKPDLFKGAPIKQVFTNDDTETMQWIQSLGGKETVVIKTMSTNTGDSRQKMQMIGGSISKGESESIHETGTELIPINEIREMPMGKQIIFMHGAKPIYCNKSRYFECEKFNGKYDLNPLEMKKFD